MGKDLIINKLQDKRILILGFGSEGQSSYHFIRKYFPELPIVIADESSDIATHLFENDKYAQDISYKRNTETFDDYDIVLKSPGISLKKRLGSIDKTKISSQTDLFLQAFAPQCIGVTGTKGKSTTTSLLSHVLKAQYPNTLMAGNIGIPLFDIIEQIDEDTKIVLELSSHQLEFIRNSPHISILLNLFEEHLDHYNSYKDYQLAKFNIARYQSNKDYFVYNTGDKQIAALLEENLVESTCVGFSFRQTEASQSFVKNGCFWLKMGKMGHLVEIGEVGGAFPLKGEHNLENVAAAIAALSYVEEIDIQKINNTFYSFNPLPHRLELLGEADGIFFYNDSISTVPQASIAAVKALKNVNTIILGGMDRGIDYTHLADFLGKSAVENFIFTGDAGKRIMELFENVENAENIENKKSFFCTSYQEIVRIAKECTKKGSICLLSPAAASYDQFKNFEERGDAYRKLVLG
jgi:UDP-N-acetylmuramoylalanine--D-glutamate ligase